MYFCLTRLYVVIIYDTWIIVDEMFGTQKGIVLLLSLTEGTEVVVNSIEDDVWESKDERPGILNDEVESWELVLTMFVNVHDVFSHGE